VHQQRPALDPAVLRSVRAGEHASFDRLAFEFSTTAVPGYRVEYIDGPAYQCATGDVVSVRGATTVLVQLSPAQAHTEAGAATIERQRQQLDLRMLKEIRLSCDFEGNVSWVVGVAERAPYRVAELSNPPRLVIDFKQ
jgi:hypothetical protein